MGTMHLGVSPRGRQLRGEEGEGSWYAAGVPPPCLGPLQPGMPEDGGTGTAWDWDRWPVGIGTCFQPGNGSCTCSGPGDGDWLLCLGEGGTCIPKKNPRGFSPEAGDCPRSLLSSLNAIPYTRVQECKRKGVHENKSAEVQAYKNKRTLNFLGG